MNKQPKYYMQTDPLWKNISYSVPGENTNIGESGCGPTSAAMLISTLTGDSKITPVETCIWALKHGYKAINQGTYYSYFVPQFAAYGIKCERLNISRMLNDPDNPIHDKALNLLKDGYYLIALMGPGTWTTGGHFVVVWWCDNVYHINDPYSKQSKKIRGDIRTFRKECRMYWAIDAKEYNEEDDDMVDFNKLTDEQIDSLIKRINKYQQSQQVDAYAKEAAMKAVQSGIFSDGNKDGVLDAPQAYLKRQDLAVVLDRKGLL